MNHEKKEIVYLKADEQSLLFFQALANKNRLDIIRLLKKNEASITELSQALGLSTALITKHIQLLEEAGIVKSYTNPGKRGLKKLCYLALNEAQIIFNNDYQEITRSFEEVEIPISAYSDYDIAAPCGLATEDKVFGNIDNPRYFSAVNRYSVSLLWFSSGYITYPIPLMDVDLKRTEEIEISLEICSEHPGFNSSWKSDIQFQMNGVNLGMWTSPADFGDRKGRYTPAWWTLGTEYGLLKTLLINEEGTFMDGTQIGATPLSKILENRKDKDQLTFTISTYPKDGHYGGINLFGRHFGDYNQPIIFRFYYRRANLQRSIQSSSITE